MDLRENKAGQKKSDQSIYFASYFVNDLRMVLTKKKKKGRY